MKREAVCAGRRFGRLTCVELDEEGGWLCRCGCRRLEAARSGMTHVDGTCVESILSGTLFRNNTSGYRGVSQRNGRWQAYITYARKMVRLGSYDTVEEALAARAWAEEQIRRRLENLLADGAEDEPLRLRLEAAGAGDELPLRQKIKPALGSDGK